MCVCVCAHIFPLCILTMIMNCCRNILSSVYFIYKTLAMCSVCAKHVLFSLFTFSSAGAHTFASFNWIRLSKIQHNVSRQRSQNLMKLFSEPCQFWEWHKQNRYQWRKTSFAFYHHTTGITLSQKLNSRMKSIDFNINHKTYGLYLIAIDFKSSQNKCKISMHMN